jgi:nitric oxide reductase NorQ protein
MKSSSRKTGKTALQLPFYRSQGNEIELFDYAWRNQLPIFINGPNGCGKTRFVKYMSTKLKQPLYIVSGHEDLSAADLIGRHIKDKNGSYWKDGPLTQAVRNGGFCYLDNVAEVRRNTLEILQPLTDNDRILSTELTGEILQASDKFMLIVSHNPEYKNLINSMSPSTRQRFISMSFNIPSAELEQDILMGEAGIDEHNAYKLVHLANSLRALNDQNPNTSPSTRLLVNAATLIKDGLPVLDACRASLVEPLTDDNETISVLMEVVYAHFAL